MIPSPFGRIARAGALLAILSLTACAAPTEPVPEVSHFVVFFEKNSTDVTQADAVLQTVAKAHESAKETVVTVTGFSDKEETPGIDLERAKAVLERLSALGVPAASVRIVAAGNTAQIMISGEVLRAANYRAEIKLAD